MYVKLEDTGIADDRDKKSIELDARMSYNGGYMERVR